MAPTSADLVAIQPELLCSEGQAGGVGTAPAVRPSPVRLPCGLTPIPAAPGLLNTLLKVSWGRLSGSELSSSAPESLSGFRAPWRPAAARGRALRALTRPAWLPGAGCAAAAAVAAAGLLRCAHPHAANGCSLPLPSATRQRAGMPPRRKRQRAAAAVDPASLAGMPPDIVQVGGGGAEHALAAPASGCPGPASFALCGQHPTPASSIQTLPADHRPPLGRPRQAQQPRNRGSRPGFAGHVQPVRGRGMA